VDAEIQSEPPEGAPPPDTADGEVPPMATPEPAKHKSSTKVIVEWGVLIVAALLIALVVRAFLFQAFYIPSESMLPTLQKNDRVLVNKLSYKLHPVHRGDIVVFKAPKNIEPPVKDLVKRVIGLPGETVSGKDGHVYINGQQLTEKYLPNNGNAVSNFPSLKDVTPPPTCTHGSAPTVPCTLPPNCYWVMGDNRTVSEDSRYFGCILKKDIVGRVFIRIWPLSRIDLL
jgi:signal peptidase I